MEELHWWLLAHSEIFSTIQLWKDCLQHASLPISVEFLLLSQDLHTPNIPTARPALLWRRKKDSVWEELFCSTPAWRGSLGDEASIALSAGSTRGSPGLYGAEQARAHKSHRLHLHLHQCDCARTPAQTLSCRCSLPARVLSDVPWHSCQLAPPKPMLQHRSGGCEQNRGGHP